MGQKRYNLVLSTEVYDEIKRVADSRDTTVRDILRRFVKLGLLAIDIEDDPDAHLLIRDAETETLIVFY
jgi:hypothetical protein